MDGSHDYSFRNRDFTAVPPLSPTQNACGDRGLPIGEDWEIAAPRTDSRLFRYFTEDLRLFLEDAFGVSLRIRRVPDAPSYARTRRKCILLAREEDMPDCPVGSDEAGAYRIIVTESGVAVIGKTERGTAKGVYDLEDGPDCASCAGNWSDEDAEFEVNCPSCGKTIRLTDDMLDEGSIVCPGCGETLAFDLDDEDEKDEKADKPKDAEK